MGVDTVLDAQHEKFSIAPIVVFCDVDIISNLPEELRTHILSFLPTEDAVRTSVLSTKWNQLWTTLTTLSFDDTSFITPNGGEILKTYFNNFVERVLLSGSLVIHNFHLSCSTRLDAFRISSWISSVLSRDVHKLHITCKPFQELLLPWSLLYNCHSLVDLSIQMTCTLHVPTSICFSTLKVLKLERVTFLNVYASRSNEIRMTFQVLEELCFSNCKWKDVKDVNVDAPMLNNFSFYNGDMNRKVDHVIRIFASSLRKINISGFISEEFVLTSPLSVKYASIEHYISNPRQRVPTCVIACKLLVQFSNLKFLTLSWQNIEAFACIEDLQESLPTASNLIQLTIIEVAKFVAKPVLVGKLIAFLWSLPILESLNFNLETQRFCNDEMVLEEVVPPCFETHLKVVKFLISKSTTIGLEFVEFLLKNAMVLEKMSIYCLESDIVAIKEKLLDFPRGSDHALIFFNE